MSNFRATCGLCCGFCQGEKPDRFSSHVWDQFRAKAIVPCNARVYVNNMTGDYMRLEHGGRKYSMDVVKKAYRTMITGSGWAKFTADNNLRNGSVVIFDMDKRPRQAYIGNFSDGIFQNNPAHAAGEMAPAEGSTDYDADDIGIDVDYTNGVNLTTQERDRLDNMLLWFEEEFTGKPIVHRLTATNIAHGNMKLPRRVAASLHIPKQGMFGVCPRTRGANCVVSYNMCSDGCIALCKEDRRKFVAKNSLEVNKHIMFFKTPSKPQLNLMMVVCKI